MNSKPPSFSPTHRPQSSSFLGLPYRILNMNLKKELLWGLWVNPKPVQRKDNEPEVVARAARVMGPVVSWEPTVP